MYNVRELRLFINIEYEDTMNEFLLNPNIAYVAIVILFMLTVFAILAPGTGLLELGAFLMLLIVGYQVYSLPVNVWALLVLLAAAVPFIFALRQKRTTLNLLLTVLAFLLGSVFLFREGEWWQPAVHPALAMVVSILGGGFLYLMSVKGLEARTLAPSHDLEGLIGAIGEARTDINPEGSIYAQKEMWTALSEKPIKAGSRVEIVGREGLLLIVKEYKGK